ncbi:hypothetical protein C4D60_Mb09t17200 [Musa balbisiana]|uniref:Tetraspanin n=1 Tax=Musa balbisiana TaxID=52838 RepID=A0A4S8IH47_MUSBA|nr:hypothetical protein C4D60_Mb09t17200 [Musa balbisiana]
MVQISNSLVGFLNFLTLLISFPILGAGLWFRLHAATECERFLQLPLLVLGGFLLVVSVVGLIGACCRVSFVMWLYLFVMFLLILAMIVFTIFAFVVTNKGVGEAASGVGFKEYRLSDYSGWLQKRVENWETWREIDGCLKDAKVCAGFEGLAGLQASQFFAKNLSPLQSGCCKPPTFCGFQYKNATFWTIPTTGLKSTDADCKLWSNEQDKLCYDCGSCKAGVLATLKAKWKAVSIFNVALLVILIIVYSIGCCALRNNRAKTHGGYYPYAR